MKDQYDFLNGGGWGGKSMAKRCYEDHKPLKIGEFEVFGGSCSSPVVKDADIYIGFDYSMSFSTGHWPWDKKTEEVYFHIADMQAPSDAESFKKMVAWAADQIKAGKRLHAGCIGGHGRTGTFLAALVTHMTGELDSITYVRTNYCKKAVETSTQIAFLAKHYGIKAVEGSKAGFVSKTVPSSTVSSYPKGKVGPMSSGKAKPAKAKRQIVPVGSKKNIWKTPATV